MFASFENVEYKLTAEDGKKADLLLISCVRFLLLLSAVAHSAGQATNSLAGSLLAFSFQVKIVW